MKKYVFGLLIVFGVAGLLLLDRAPNNANQKPANKTTKLYVALGDSVAAGVGLKDDSDASACDRTNQSYPAVTASKLHYRLMNLACSGASLPMGVSGGQTVNNLPLDSQLNRLFSQPRPDIISLTIGANDAQWTRLLAACYSGECGSTDMAALDGRLATLSNNLHTALGTIVSHYGKLAPPVFVTGYHQVFPSDEVVNCADLTNINIDERRFGRQLQTSLSTITEQSLSDFPFATYVPVNFSGHELCSAQPWVQGLADKQPYHPTADGQNEFASELVKAINSQRSSR